MDIVTIHHESHKQHGSLTLIGNGGGFILSKEISLGLIEDLQRSYNLISEYELNQLRDKNYLLSDPEHYLHDYYENGKRLPDGYTIDDCKRLAGYEPSEVDNQEKERDFIPHFGVVYFLSGNGFIKIGRTSNLKDRKKWFDVKLPFKVEVIHVVNTNEIYSCETHFHEKYADKRANGEWFNLTAEDVAEIKRVEEMNF